MKRKKFWGTAAATVAAVSLAACSSGGTTNASSESPGGAGAAQTASILNNWFASAEQGGYWDAGAKQYAKPQGVTLDVRQGGPGIQTIPQVTAGQATFGIGNADEVLVARKNGLPIVAVAAPLGLNPQCVLYHPGTGINGFADLNGKQVSRVPSPWWDYIKSHFKLDKAQAINYNGTLAEFKQNKNLAQQCYITSDPYSAKQAGIDFGVLSIAKDGGYNPYPELLYTTESVIKDKPEMVKAVVAAVNQGWVNFAADKTVAKDAVKAANKDADMPLFDYAWQAMKDGDFFAKPAGVMSEERWKTLRDQLAEIGLVPADFDYSKAYTNQFAAGS